MTARLDDDRVPLRPRVTPPDNDRDADALLPRSSTVPYRAGHGAVIRETALADALIAGAVAQPEPAAAWLNRAERHADCPQTPPCGLPGFHAPDECAERDTQPMGAPEPQLDVATKARLAAAAVGMYAATHGRASVELGVPLANGEYDLRRALLATALRNDARRAGFALDSLATALAPTVEAARANREALALLEDMHRGIERGVTGPSWPATILAMGGGRG